MGADQVHEPGGVLARDGSNGDFGHGGFGEDGVGVGGVGGSDLVDAEGGLAPAAGEDFAARVAGEAFDA